MWDFLGARNFLKWLQGSESCGLHGEKKCKKEATSPHPRYFIYSIVTHQSIPDRDKERSKTLLPLHVNVEHCTDHFKFPISSANTSMLKSLSSGSWNPFRKEDPKELVRKWKSSIRSEIRSTEREMNSLILEQKKATASIKEAAKRNDMTSAKVRVILLFFPSTTSKHRPPTSLYPHPHKHRFSPRKSSDYAPQ